MDRTSDLLAPAQTNLALYEELRRAGRPADELARARRGYELAMLLFAGQYRASGKPFVAHLVGTASILLRLGARPELVLAGLLHAAYASGEFGGWRRKVDERKRAAVRAAVGEPAEAVILRYTRMPFSAAGLPATLAVLDGLPALDRDVLAVRLCNELEELVDRGAAYAGKSIDGAGPAACELAARLGLPELGAALERARRDNAGAALPEELRAARAGSYVVPPATHRARLGLRLVRALAARLRR